MKALHAVILALALLLGANALPKSRSVSLHQLERRLRTIAEPGFRNAIDNSIKNYLDTKVRDIIRNGSEKLGVPPLDPVKTEKLEFDINEEILKLKGKVENVEISGASNFRVESVKTDLLSLSAEIEISLDEARITAERYKIEGNLLGTVPLNGEGSLDIVLKRLGLKVRVALGIRDDQTIFVKELELDVSLGEAKVQLEGLLGGNLANDLLSKLLPEIVEKLKGPILEKAAEIIKALANKKLEGITIGDILDLINSGKRV